MHKPSLIASVLELLSEDEDPEVLVAIESACKALLRTIPKEEAPSYVGAVRKAVGSARDAQRRKELDAPVEVPGFGLPKALEPIVEIYLQGLLQVGASVFKIKLNIFLDTLIQKRFFLDKGNK